MQVGIVTLGCDKNTVDNEYLAGLLASQGIDVHPTQSTDEAHHLDAVVITTCGFTQKAREENVAQIVEWAEFKNRRDNGLRLYLSGCLTQRYARELTESIPEIDGLVGVGQWGRLARMIAGERFNVRYPRPDRKKVLVDLKHSLPRQALDHRPYAYLKISDGCNHKCTFCSIPLMKGKLRSLPRKMVLDEARRLIDRGVREINIVAQDTADYGRDRYKQTRLHDVVRDIVNLDGDFRLRLLYLYPAGITNELIELMADHPKLCPYVDMPLQHLDPDVMRLMKRPYRNIHAEGLIETLRERVPGIAIRSTLIVGFPGETEAAYRRLIEGIERIRFDWLGAFTFSIEEETPSAKMERQLKESVKKKRYDNLMRIQAKIAKENSRARIGTRERVLIEAKAESPDNVYVGRSAREAPEVDGLVFVESDRALNVGDMVDVTIDAASTYDVFAKLDEPRTAASRPAQSVSAQLY